MFSHERLVKEIEAVPFYEGIDAQEVAAKVDELMQIGRTKKAACTGCLIPK